MDFELIGNTYATVFFMKFIENEVAAATIRDAAKVKIQQEMNGKPQVLIDKALANSNRFNLLIDLLPNVGRM